MVSKMNKIIITAIKDFFCYYRYCCYSYRQALIKSYTFILDFPNREEVELYYACFVFVVFMTSPNQGKEIKNIWFLTFAGCSDFVN